MKKLNQVSYAFCGYYYEYNLLFLKIIFKINFTTIMFRGGNFSQQSASIVNNTNITNNINNGRGHGPDFSWLPSDDEDDESNNKENDDTRSNKRKNETNIDDEDDEELKKEPLMKSKLSNGVQRSTRGYLKKQRIIA